MSDQGDVTRREDGARRAEPPCEVTPLYAALGRRMGRIDAWTKSTSDAFRSMVWLCAIIIASAGLILTFGPLLGTGPSFDDVIDDSKTATTDSWIARSFDAEYRFEPDDDGHLVVTVTETIDIFVPETLTMSTIERVVPAQLEQHDLRPTLVSAQLDGNDANVSLQQRGTESHLTVTSAAPLTGDHELQWTYKLHDLALPSVSETTGQENLAVVIDIFGPDWPHGTTETTFRLLVPEEYTQTWAEAPAGGLSWLLLSASMILTPEPGPDGFVQYGVTNDQNLPPHATAWFRLSFAPDAFVMPPPSTLYWVLVIAPSIPVLVLIFWMLLALGARAVPWRDAAGDPWIIPQYDPIDLPMRVSAAVWASTGTAPLAEVLSDDTAPGGDLPKNSRRARREKRQWREERARREGNARRASAARTTAAALVKSRGQGRWRLRFSAGWQEAIAKGYRRIPKGAARDLLLAGIVSLPFLQLGIVRQMSGRESFTQFWWPAIVLLVTVAMAILVWLIVHSTNPLTESGTRKRQYLEGLADYIDQTQLAHRVTANDRLLPYVALFSSPTEAKQVVDRVFEDAPVLPPDPEALTTTRLAVRVTTVSLAIAAFAWAIWVPAPYARAEDGLVAGEVRGDRGLGVEWFDIEATLVAEEAGSRLDVTETLSVYFNDAYSYVPQVTRMYRDQVDGHDTQLTVTSIEVDGVPVEFNTRRYADMAFVSTTFSEPRDGPAEVVVRYSLASPVAEILEGGAATEQLRWTALNDGFDWVWGFDLADSEEDRLSWQVVLPMRGGMVRLHVPTALADQVVGESGELATRASTVGSYAVESFESVEANDGVTTYTVDATVDEHGLVRNHDFGVQLRFAAGTVPGTADATDWWRYTVATQWALWAALALAIVSITLLTAGAVRAKEPHIVRRGWPRDWLLFIPVALGAASIGLWFVAGKGRSEYDDLFIALALIASTVIIAAMITAGIRMNNGTEKAATDD